MKKLENEILKTLIDKYEHSKLSTTGTKVKRHIKLTTADEVLSSYTFLDSYKYASENDEIILALENKGFIFAEFKNDSFESLELNLAKVDEIYTYLKIENPLKEVDKCLEILSKYHFDNYLDDFLNYCLNYLKEKRTLPKEYFTDSENLKLILNCFSALFNLEKETKERDFSVKYLKDSKVFETIKKRVIKIIRDFEDLKELDDGQILALYNISQNSAYTLIKNKFVFKLNEQIIDLNKLKYEFSLSDEMIDKIQILNEPIKKIITVENLTTFYSLKDDDALIIYLAGYHNHSKQKLLAKIFEVYPNSEYYHYGDIDAGGFWIFVNLKNKTKMPFKPYQMSIKELRENQNHLKKLTINDYKRLRDMYDDERFLVFKDTIKYMLENNVKLEQEILD